MSMQCGENSNRWQFANMASFKYLWHLICIGYISLILYKAEVLFGVLEAIELSQDEISQYKQRNVRIQRLHLLTLAAEHTHHMKFQGPLSPFLSSPLKAHGFVDTIPTPLVISLSTSISPCHKEGTIECTKKKKKKKFTDKSMQHSEKELNCFLLFEKVNATLQCSWISMFFFTPNEAEKSDQFNKENMLVRGYRCVSVRTCFSICCLL